MKTHGILLVLAMLGLLALGCGQVDPNDLSEHDPDSGQFAPDGPYLGTTTSDDKPVPGGRLVYGLPAETNSWNPSLALWGAYSLQVARALFDTLYMYDANGFARPNLVARAEHNDDYTQWTVTLRPNIRFHNGRVMKAADVVHLNDYIRESPVLGGAYHLTALDRTDILDDLTYRMYATKPWPTMPDAATTQLSVAADVDWMRSSDWARPIGTGPFKIARWDLGHSLTVVRNPDYWRVDRWGTRLPYVDAIEFQVIPDDLTRADAVSDGKLDLMMQTLATPSLAELRQQCRRGVMQCFSDEKGETPENHVALNTTQPPFNDPDARRAVAVAIDRDDYVRKVTNGIALPADGMYQPNSPWHSPSNYPAYNPDEARRLAAAVRQRHGGRFRFQLIGARTEEAARIMQYLQSAWNAIGIDVDLVMTENQRKIIQQVTGEFQASLTQNFDATHPTLTMAFIDPSQTAPNQPTLVFPRLSDRELGDRIESLVRLPPNTEQWRAGNARVMERLNELIPFVWLDHAPRTIIARSNLVNVVRSTLPDGESAADFSAGAHQLSQIWIRRPDQPVTPN